MRNKLSLSKKQLNLLYVIVHVLAWTLLFLIPFAFFNVALSDGSGLVNLVILTKALIIFYINFLFLVPRYLLQKKLSIFFTCIIVLLLFNFTLSYFEIIYLKPPKNPALEFKMPPPGMETKNHNNEFGLGKPPMEHGPDDEFFEKGRPFFGFRFLGQISFVLMLIGVSTSLKLTEEWFNNEKHKELVKNEQLSTELAFLKSQINPHFLFNSLNSIYSLSHKKSDQAPEAIIQLSKIMRYVIDDANNSTVLLEKELDHLSDYIELQKLRLTDKTKLLYTVNNQSKNEMIEPMLLVPFVENAFKHGVDSFNQSYITIKIDITPNHLVFKSTNTIASQKPQGLEEESGIGLKNVIRRLELLYPNEHKLEIFEEEKLYAVTLTLKLKSHELLNS